MSHPVSLLGPSIIMQEHQQLDFKQETNPLESAMLFITRIATQWSAYSTYLISWQSITIIALTLIYIYYKYKFSYWARRGIKTPPPIPWFGTSLYPLIIAKPNLELILHRKYGKVYGLYDGFLGTNPTLVCGHPEVIKQVTIKHFHSFTNRRRPATYLSIRYRALTYMMDDEWKQLRCLIAPIFTSNKLKRMFELMKRCTGHLQEAIASHGSQEVDLKKLFAVYTVDVISACCFSMDLKDYRHPDSQILSSARRFFEVTKMKMAFAATLPKQLLKLIGFDINDTKSIDFFEKFTTDIIRKRRQLLTKANNSNSKQSIGRPDDFLQILLDAVNSDTHIKSYYTNGSDRKLDQSSISSAVAATAGVKTIKSQDHENHESRNQTEQVENVNRNGTKLDSDDNDNVVSDKQQQQQEQQVAYKLGDLEILAQTMLFFAVGHETTATLLSSCGLLLALHADMQARLYEEVSKAFQADLGDITYTRLLELEYLDAFVCETLRYFTPTLTFDREASEDVELELDNGEKLLVPRGMGIVIPFHAIHHDADNYDEPEQFNPERFMPEHRGKIKPGTFIPFGSGPRYCLAMRFALMEAKLALAHLIHRYQFVQSANTKWPPTYRHHYMLLQMQWPKIRFVERNQQTTAAQGA